MKSILHFIKKFDVFCVFIIFAITLFSYCFLYETISTDEIWNFQNIYKMYNGYTIYKDCNVIITPLFFIIGNLLFKIFSANLLSFKFYNLIIYTFLATVLYILFKSLEFNKMKSFLFSTIIISIFMSVIDAGANYNILAIVFVIIGINFVLHSREKNIYLIFNSFIIYVTIFTKQNIGAYYVVGICLSEILLNKNIVATMKRLLIQAIPALILSCISLFIMYKYNILYDFINYAILGINEFSFSNFAFDFWSILLLIVIIFIYLFALWIINKHFITDSKIINNLKLLIYISLPLNLVIYPILNLYHFLLSLVFIMILFFYMLDFLIFTPILENKLYNKLAFTIVLAIISFELFYSVLKTSTLRKVPFYYKDMNSPYYNCYFSSEMSSKINTITEYIQEENSKNIDVIVFSNEAALYMIPLRTKSWIL